MVSILYSFFSFFIKRSCFLYNILEQWPIWNPLLNTIKALKLITQEVVKLSSYYCISPSTIIIQIWGQFRRHHCIKKQEAVLYVMDLFLQLLITLNLKGEMYAIKFFFTPFHTSMTFNSGDIQCQTSFAMTYILTQYEVVFWNTFEELWHCTPNSPPFVVRSLLYFFFLKPDFSYIFFRNANITFSPKQHYT
jgi:hypothetical protein